MNDIYYILTVDVPEKGVLSLTISDSLGQAIDSLNVPHEGPVDNLLLTEVDNLFKRNSISKSVLAEVRAGAGIDKNSSLCRIVTSFASAIAAARGRP